MQLEDEDAARDLLYYRCSTDVAAFALHFFPHYCSKPFNEFHNSLFRDWSAPFRGVRRAYGAPRGYAKSTLLALIKPIHDICYGYEKYICIFSNSQAQAVGRLKDIRREIFTNPMLLDLYRIRALSRVPAEKQFGVVCDGHETQLAAFGAGTEIRGVRFGEHRPTKVICDDVEHSEEVFNEEIRRKYEDWFFQVVSFLGTKDTNVEFVGTVLHQKSLLVGLSKNPSYSGKIYRAVEAWATNESLWDEWKKIYTNLDDDERKVKANAFYEANKEKMLEGSKVFWPEHEDYYYLMQELISTGRRSFNKEKQNNPLGNEDSVFENFNYYREVSGGLEIERSGKIIPWDELQPFGVLDPSTGQTKAKSGKLGDYACLLTGYQDRRGRCFVHSDETKRLSPTKQIQSIFDHQERYGYEKFGVETNLYRNLLLPNIIDERNRREKASGKLVKVAFYDIENTENKEKRIYTLEPRVTHGWILFNRTLSKEYMDQMQDFPHADHDDCPDATEMLWGLMNKRYTASPLSINAMGAR